MTYCRVVSEVISNARANENQRQRNEPDASCPELWALQAPRQNIQGSHQKY